MKIVQTLVYAMRIFFSWLIFRHQLSSYVLTFLIVNYFSFYYFIFYNYSRYILFFLLFYHKIVPANGAQCKPKIVWTLNLTFYIQDFLMCYLRCGKSHINGSEFMQEIYSILKMSCFRYVSR